MTRYSLSSNEPLILRDGRPFGDVGTFGGTSMDWPLPQTISGMCRTAVGFVRGDSYFSDSENLEKILSIGIKRMLPCYSEGSGEEFLLPAPADIVFTENDKEEDRKDIQHIYPLAYSGLSSGEGTDLKSDLWLYPSLDIKGKPTQSPRFIRWELAKKYFENTIQAQGMEIDIRRQAIAGPVRDLRIHTAIEPLTRSVDEGRLYAESGMYLKTTEPRDLKSLPGTWPASYKGDIGISFEIDGVNPDERLPDPLYLGGERRRVDISPIPEKPFPAVPDFFKDQVFLKLVLVTHGDFGGWVPEWLLPGGNISDISWVREPKTGIEIRLRSAVVNGWEAVSGWDYAKKTRKAFRKLVKPGAVYLVELKNSSESEHLAGKLWGESICATGSQAEKDGFGQVLIAKTNISTGRK